MRAIQSAARGVSLCVSMVLYIQVSPAQREDQRRQISPADRDQQRETEKTSGAAFCVRVSVSLLSLCIDTKKRDQRGGGLSVCVMVCYGVLNVVTVSVSLPNVRGGVTIRAAFFGGVYFGGGDTSGGGA